MVQFVATFSHPGVLDTHSAVIDWDDGATSAGVVSGTGGQRTVTGSHIYADAGTFTIQVTVTSKVMGRAEVNELEQPISVNEEEEVEKPEDCPLLFTDLVPGV